MTAPASADSVCGTEACWADAQGVADSQQVIAAAAKLRAREATWAVDARTRGRGYAKALEAPANGVKLQPHSPLGLTSGPVSYPKACQRVR